MNSRHLIVKLLILIVFGECSSNADEFYGTCEDSFSCGNISGFGYPFRRLQDPAYCGYPGFELNCDEQNLTTIDITNMTYQILTVDPTSQILRIVREDMIGSTCPKELVNTTIDYNLFGYTPGYMNISFLFGCPASSNSMGMGSISCDNNGGSPVFLLPGIQVPESCETSIIVPSPDRYVNPTELGPVLQQGFEVWWKMGAWPCTDCTRSGGQCIYNNYTRLTTCACPEPPFLADSCYTANTTRVGSSPPSGMQLFD